MTRKERIRDLGERLKEALRDDLLNVADDMPGHIGMKVLQQIEDLPPEPYGETILETWEDLLKHAHEYKDWYDFLDCELPRVFFVVDKEGGLHYSATCIPSFWQGESWSEYPWRLSPSLPISLTSEWLEEAFEIRRRAPWATLCRECGVNICAPHSDKCRVCGHDDEKKEEELTVVLLRAEEEFEEEDLDLDYKDEFVLKLHELLEKVWYRDFHRHQMGILKSGWADVPAIVVKVNIGKVTGIQVEDYPFLAMDDFMYRPPIPPELSDLVEKLNEEVGNETDRCHP